MSFTQAVCEELAEQVGHQCSAPHCRAPTGRPGGHEPNGGDGAHIEGDKPGTARHNPMQDAVLRQSAINGIWLCPSCHRNVDRYGHAYEVGELHRWKAVAIASHKEEFLRPRVAFGGFTIVDEIGRAQKFLKKHEQALEGMLHMRQQADPFNGDAMVPYQLQPKVYSLTYGMARLGWNQTSDDFCYSPEYGSRQREYLRLVDKLNALGPFGINPARPYVNFRMAKGVFGEYFIDPAAELIYALRDFHTEFQKYIRGGS